MMFALFGNVNNGDDTVVIHLWTVLIALAIIALLVYIFRHRRF